MATILRGEGNHRWSKKNLVTMKGGYDIHKCELCGAEVKTQGLQQYTSNKLTREELFTCPKAPKVAGAEYVTITNCRGTGAAFSIITSGTVHKVIDVPKGEKFTARGVWVMGVGTYVLVLWEECRVSTEKEIELAGYNKPVIINKVEEVVEKAKTTRKVGDVHSNGIWSWTEYKPGKFDWRIKK